MAKSCLALDRMKIHMRYEQELAVQLESVSQGNHEQPFSRFPCFYRSFKRHLKPIWQWSPQSMSLHSLHITKEKVRGSPSNTDPSIKSIKYRLG